MLTVGIDPGLSGALALNFGDRVDTWAIPTLKICNTASRKNRVVTVIDVTELRALARELELLQPECVYIEQVGGMPRDGASRAFNFGVTFGRTLEIFEAAGLKVRLVAPNVWRAKLGVRAEAKRNELDTKASSRLVASTLWPSSASQWSTASKADHAEAALISEFARRFPEYGSRKEKAPPARKPRRSRMFGG